MTDDLEQRLNRATKAGERDAIRKENDRIKDAGVKLNRLIAEGKLKVVKP
jgi:hypothetical protein